MGDDPRVPRDLQTTAFSLVPRTLGEALQYCELMAKSTCIPKEYQGKPADILVAVQYGLEIGIPPMTMIQNSYVVNGRPSIFGDIGLAKVKQQPDYVDTIETIEKIDGVLTATCIAKRRGQEDVKRTFSMADAVEAKLDKDRGTQTSQYKLYPKRMLQMRARWWALRDQWPDVLKGIRIKEEMDAGVIEGEAERVVPLAISLGDQIDAVNSPEQWSAARDDLVRSQKDLQPHEYTNLASALQAKKALVSIKTRTDEVAARVAKAAETTRHGKNSTGTDSRVRDAQDAPVDDRSATEETASGSGSVGRRDRDTGKADSSDNKGGKQPG